MNNKNFFIFFIFIFAININVIAQKTSGHNDEISSLAFFPDSKIITASWDNTLKLWDTTGTPEIRTFRGHTGQVTCVAISPDGETFFSGSGDETIRIWDKNSEISKKKLTGHYGGVTCIATNPKDENIIASGSWDMQVILWDLKNDKKTVIYSHSKKINSIAFSPDGKYIVSAANDKIIIWDIKKQQQQIITQVETQCVAFGSDSLCFASAGKDKKVKIWDIKSKRNIQTFEPKDKIYGHGGTVNSIAYSPSGEYIVSAGADDKIGGDTTTIQWNINTKKPIAVFNENMEVKCVAFSPDGKKIATGSFKTLNIWTTNTGNNKQIFRNTDEIKCIAINPMDKNIIASGGLHTIKLLDKTNKTEIESYPEHAIIFYSIDFSSDGKYIVSGDDDIYENNIKLWKADSLKKAKTFTGHRKGKVYSVAFSPDNNHFVSGSEDKTIKLWNINTQLNKNYKIEEIETFKGHKKAVKSVDFNNTGRLIVSGSEDNTVKIWDTTGTVLHTLEGHINSVECVKFSNNGKFIASGSADNTIKLWDVNEGKLIKTFIGHTSGVESVAFSSDDKYIVSASLDNTIKTWNITTGKSENTYKKHTGGVYAVTFGDNNEIISGSADGSIKSWNKNINTVISYTHIEIPDTTSKIISGKSNLKPTPKLSSKITFIDKSGDDILNANETAEIKVEITNTGNAIAEQLTANINCSNTNIDITDENKNIHSIESNKTKTITFKIKANKKLTGNDIKFDITFSGKNTPPNKSINIYTQESGKPKLEFVGTIIEEITYENNNNIIENKELIKTTITIKNSGEGTAKNVVYKITLNNKNIIESNINANPLTDTIGTLNPNETYDIDFYFTADCNFTDTELPIKIELTEQNGKYGGTFPLGLTMQQLNPCIDSPILTAEIKFTGKNNNIIDANEIAKIKVTIINSGTEPASNIATIIKCNNNDITILKKKGVVSYLDAGASETVEFKVEANDIIKDGTAKFDFTFTEKKGYEPAPAICLINTRKKGLPKLEYVRTIIKETAPIIKNDSIENGEDIQATIIIKNTGSGNAENIQYEILINDKDTINIKTIGFSLTGNIPILEIGDSTEINFAFNVAYKYRNENLFFKIKLNNNKVFSLGLTMNIINQNVDINIPEADANNSNIYALVIGNENYKNNNNVDYAINDADIFTKYLINSFGIPKDNITTLKDVGVVDFDTEIGNFKEQQKLNPNSKFIFYYAGHGAIDANGKSYLVPVDVNNAKLIKHGIPLDTLYNNLTENKTARVTFFIDACFSGEIPKKGNRPFGGRPANKTPIKGNSVVFAATSPTETAKPFDKQKHGVFTYCLLRILQDTGGNITYEELDKKLKKDVADLKNTQHPTTTPNQDLKDQWKNWKINE